MNIIQSIKGVLRDGGVVRAVWDFKISLFLLPLLCAAGLSFWGPPAFCEEENLITDYYYNEAVGAYEKGDYRSAIRDFSKILMIDPNHTGAMEYLGKMGIDGSVFGHPDSRLSHIAQLAHKLEVNQEQLAQLAADYARQEQMNAEILSQAEEMEAALVHEQEEKKAFEARMTGELNQTQDKLARAEDQLDQQGEDLVNLTLDSLGYQTQIHDQIRDIMTKEDALDEKKQELRLAYNDSRLAQNTLRRDRLQHQKEMLEAEGLQLAAEKELQTKEDTFLKRQAKYEKMLRESRRDYSLLDDKMIFTEFKLRDRERLLDQKDAKLTQLKRGLRRIEEKLAFLQTELWVKGQMAGQTSGGEFHDPGIDQQRREMIQKQDKLITLLRDKLSLTEKKLQDMSRKENAVDDETAFRLQQELDKARGDLEEAASALSRKSEEYELLEVRLSDTRQRLELVEEIIKDKDRQIEGLEQQLTDAVSDMEQ